MTISPPPNVKVNHKISPDILTSGIDTLVLAIDVEWLDSFFFDYLAVMKELAISDNKDSVIIFKNEDESKTWVFSIKTHGIKGHEWIISNSYYSITVGNWKSPQSRPSIMVRISAEALWYMDPIVACEDLKEFIISQHGEIVIIKPSRLDICLDLLLPSNIWHKNLDDHFTTRAEYTAVHKSHRELTGFSIGKGDISARLYDKLKEIQKSKKQWMFKVWGKSEFPENEKVIRIEFQLRREALKSLGVETLDNLFSHLENIWAYCTQNWLKLQDMPNAHSSQQHTFMWWEAAQNSFLGIQKPTPLIRCQSIRTSTKQQFDATYGNLSSFAAIVYERANCPMDESISLEGVLLDFYDAAESYQKDNYRLSIDVQDKRAKYNRKTKKIIEVDKKRQELAHPSNLPVREIIKNKWRNING